MDIDNSYLRSLRDKTAGHLCGGLAIIYMTALESQGIPARYVGIFSKDKEPYDSHATVEFWYKGRWHASDPTFNVMFKHNNQWLSYSQLHRLVKEGKPYKIVSNGYPIIPERAIENYYIKIEDLMTYMVIHPAEIMVENKNQRYQMQLFPNDWDGAITYRDGNRKDVKNYGGIYNYLGQGPLR